MRARLDTIDGGMEMVVGQVRVARGHARVLMMGEGLQFTRLGSVHRVVGKEGVLEVVQPEISDAGLGHGPSEGAAHRAPVLERKQFAVEACWQAAQRFECDIIQADVLGVAIFRYRHRHDAVLTVYRLAREREDITAPQTGIEGDQHKRLQILRPGLLAGGQ